MLEKNNDVEKKEDPTSHRREKFRQDKKAPRSKELASVVILLMGWLLICICGGHMIQYLVQLLRHELRFNYSEVADVNAMFKHIYHLFRVMICTLTPAMLSIFITAVLSPLILSGIYFCAKSIKIDLKRASPFSGVKRIISARIITECVKIICKFLLFGSASTLFFLQNETFFTQLLP